MPMSVKIEPINRDIVLFLADMSPDARSNALADFARTEIASARAQNIRVLGPIPRERTFVDGRLDAPLESVRPDGVIHSEFELIKEVLDYIADQLDAASPVLTGRYQRSHIMLADGLEVLSGEQAPDAEEYIFVNTQPYTRKLERGASSQAPDGIYQVVAMLARRKFGEVARITFSYRTVTGGAIVSGRAGNRAENRNPAIVVRLVAR